MRIENLKDLPPHMQRQVLDKLAMEQAQKLDDMGRQKRAEEKYHNKPNVRNGIRFQSKKEGNRYDYLLQLLQAGEIRELKLQYEFTIYPSYITPDGELTRALRYKADFVYERKTAPDANGEVHWVRIVEDVKSRPTRTKDYIIKKKGMQNVLGITIQEV